MSGATASHSSPYTGKVLQYVMATPEAEDDGDNTSRLAVGNEASLADIEGFARRFDCEVRDSYGSTEGLIIIRRSVGHARPCLGNGGDGVRSSTLRRGSKRRMPSSMQMVISRMRTAPSGSWCKSTPGSHSRGITAIRKLTGLISRWDLLVGRPGLSRCRWVDLFCRARQRLDSG